MPKKKGGRVAINNIKIALYQFAHRFLYQIFLAGFDDQTLNFCDFPYPVMWALCNSLRAVQDFHNM